MPRSFASNACLSSQAREKERIRELDLKMAAEREEERRQKEIRIKRLLKSRFLFFLFLGYLVSLRRRVVHFDPCLITIQLQKTIPDQLTAGIREPQIGGVEEGAVAKPPPGV